MEPQKLGSRDQARSHRSLMPPRYPELEDESITKFYITTLEAEQHRKRPAPKVNVLIARGDVIKWFDNVNDQVLDELLSLGEEKQKDGELLRAVFIDTTALRLGWLPGEWNFRPRTIRILLSHGFSSLIIEEISSPEGRWAKLANHAFYRKNPNRTLSSFEMIYRHQYAGKQGKGMSQYIRTRHTWTYFCINYQTEAMRRLKVYLNLFPQLAYREFFLDALAFDGTTKDWKESIGGIRKKLLDAEGGRREDIDLDTRTRWLHNESKTLHIMLQDTTNFTERVAFVQAAYNKYMETLQRPENNWAVDDATDMNETFEVLLSRCRNYTAWVSNYRDRTIIQINLLFHLSSQLESRTSTSIATSTAKVAEQTRRDSASMITIAAVTMFFLPGTFVCAVLSTSFFDHQPHGVAVSDYWWILPAATVPLTFMVFSVWLGWQFVRFGAGEREMKGMEEKGVWKGMG